MASRAPVPVTDSVTSLPPVLPLAVRRTRLLPSPAGSALPTTSSAVSANRPGWAAARDSTSLSSGLSGKRSASTPISCARSTAITEASILPDGAAGKPFSVPVALTVAPSRPPSDRRSISSVPSRSLSAVSTVSAVRPPAETGPALTSRSRSWSASRLTPASLTKSDAKARAPSTSRAPPASLTSMDGLASGGCRRSISPLNLALPRISSSALKRCRSGVRETSALKPAAGSRRTASSTSLDSQAAKPEGWATASKRSPSKASPPAVLSLPDPSSVVRPGKVAANVFTAQPSGAVSAETRTSRMVVSPATTAGRATSTLPGIEGRGSAAKAASTAARRAASAWPAPAPAALPSSMRTWAPLASISKCGLPPRSTRALPSAV